MPRFATSDLGNEIYVLSEMGYPLASTQHELTDHQRAFLLNAAAAAQREASETATRPATTKARSAADELRQKINERRRK